jgi:hypothetical protein
MLTKKQERYCSRFVELFLKARMDLTRLALRSREEHSEKQIIKDAVNAAFIELDKEYAGRNVWDKPKTRL